jgi:dynein-related subfamily AAA family protein
VYEVDRIFWRKLTGGDYFNVEKILPQGARGQLHIDLSPAEPVQDFLGIQPVQGQAETHTLPDVGVVGDPTSTAPVQFNKRPNGRWGFPQQNWRDPDSLRHPAWDPQYGWPRDPHHPPTNTHDGEAVLNGVDGVHVYVVRTVDDQYFAGMTTGNTLPAGWPDVLEPLFLAQHKNAGLIRPESDAGTMSALAKEILSAFARRKNVLVYGPPGTGKTYAVAEVYRFLQGATTGGLQVLTLDPTNGATPFRLDAVSSSLPTPTRTDWVTFHQDYGYEDFMVGLRPTGNGFELEPVAGRLLDVAMDVATGPSASGLVVVDEINRGNVPKILGDFLTYMDEDYREGQPNAIEVHLPKVKGNESDNTRTEPIRRLDGTHEALAVPWFFPSEVYLLATMNSVDRAVAPLDTALGRRFERIDAMPDLVALGAWLGVDLAAVEAAIHPSDPVDVDSEASGAGDGESDEGEAAEQLADGPSEWSAPFAAVALLRYLNDEIAERLGVDFELGHTYFLKVGDWGDLARIWDLQLWPQLRDRFGARPDQLAQILRTDRSDAPAGYPFHSRRPGGRALSVAPVTGLVDELRRTTFEYLATGAQ